ncbi:glucosyltransferase domain-containing protein [Bradyrhizobium sp. CNPSo 4010]|uniref:Glucosyltransferase domain-containing protein n=1 Tax=Bradyrhizobium agreste TaxID=2751811 RepID=A0ABS0PJL2_9BRAD|nr:glucosyltransferase domain-containing protein [Bradyrhizobium agreste]MBH5397407.1 glucosyltransferase domain-containing protein [Bradyrhizobium agreste]
MQAEMLDASVARDTISRLAPPFWAVLGLNIIARGQALFAPMYSIDSYDVARKSFSGEIAYSLSDGRFVRAAMWWLQAQIGFLPIESMSASMCLSIPLFIIAGFIFAAAIVEDISPQEAFAFAAPFTLHPFATEYFYYGEVAFVTVLAVFCAAIGCMERLSCAALFGAVVLALGNYQVVIGHIAAGSLLVLVADLCLCDGASKSDLSVLLSRFLRRTAVLLAGLTVYVLCLISTKYLFPAVASGRAFRASSLELFQRLRTLGAAVASSFLPPQGIIPTASIVAVLALVLSIFLLLRATLQRRDSSAALVAALAIVAALVCATIAPLIGDIAWLAPRLLSPIALWIAALGPIGFRCAFAKLNLCLVAAFAIVIAGYVGADASILFDQRRMNLWDHQEASRIIARLEADPAFGEVTSLAVVGRRKTHPLALATSSVDMNTSGLGSPWSKLGLFEQATGYRFATPTDAQWQAAIDYCRHGTVWPLPGSVGLVHELAVVCLPQR